MKPATAHTAAGRLCCLSTLPISVPLSPQVWPAFGQGRTSSPPCMRRVGRKGREPGRVKGDHMPKRGLAPTKVCVCPECGATTKASLRNGHLYEHSAPGHPGICPKSGEVVLTGPELENSYECACGTWVRITHKGTLAQHSMPEGERCPLSGEPIVARAAPRPVVDGLLRMVPAAPAQGWAKPVTSSGGSSVYAILAGLPGHGRRRR